MSAKQLLGSLDSDYLDDKNKTTSLPRAGIVR